VDSDGQDVSTKKSWAEAEAPIASQQPTQYSGCPGTGTGGRISQLEIIGALLNVPACTNQPKGSTSLDSSVPTNLLAPELPRKGHRGHTMVFSCYSTCNNKLNHSEYIRSPLHHIVPLVSQWILRL
jgi:hypothetical protein